MCALGSVLLTTLLGCELNPPGGAFPCTGLDVDECPRGFECIEGYCWDDDPRDLGGVDASPGLDMGPRVDADVGVIPDAGPTTDPALEFTPPTVTVVDGDTSSVLVRLNRPPNGTVVLNVNSGLGAAGPLALDPPTLTFTPSNWDRPVRVDMVASATSPPGEETEEILVTPDPDSMDTTGFRDLGVSRVQVRVLDGAAPRILSTADSVTFAENSEGVAGFSLSQEPTGEVVVNFSGNGVLPVPASHTFTATDWMLTKSVRFVGVDDNIASSDRAGFVLAEVDRGRTSASNYEDAAPLLIPVAVTEDDSVGIIFTATDFSVIEGAPAAAPLWRLTSQPTGTVCIDLPFLDDRIDGWPTPEPVCRVSPIDWATPMQLPLFSAPDDGIIQNEAVVMRMGDASVNAAMTDDTTGYADLVVPITATVEDTSIPDVGMMSLPDLCPNRDYEVTITLGARPESGELHLDPRGDGIIQDQGPLPPILSNDWVAPTFNVRTLAPGQTTLTVDVRNPETTATGYVGRGPFGIPINVLGAGPPCE